jgi:hypothetical protein
VRPPEGGIRVQLMLADYAQIAGGKLFVSGGAWNVRAAAAGQISIAGTICTPWDLANRRHNLTLELIDEDDRAVVVPTPLGPQNYVMQAEFEVGRPPGLRQGTDLLAPFAIQVLLPPLEPRRYRFRVSVNGAVLSVPELILTIVAAPPGAPQ